MPPFLARSARVEDHPLVARLFLDLEVEDPVPTEAAFAERMLARTLILEDETAAPVGYAYWLPYGPMAHVGHVVVDRAARGRGAGRALLEAVRAEARAAGCTRWYLNVKQDNAPARRLYERMGFAVEHESWAMESTWSRLAALPSVPEDASGTETFCPKEEDDAAVAVSVGVDAPRIALLRARPGVVLAAVREHGCVAGFAAFDPSFPGIYPLRVRHPVLLPVLLAALRPAAKEDRVLLVVEGDARLHQVLASLGARVCHALYRMGGSLE